MRRLVGLVGVLLLASLPAAADTPDENDAWRDVAADGNSLVFGRFVGKFDSTQFHSRRILLREVTTGEEETLAVGDALGTINLCNPVFRRERSGRPKRL